MNASTDSSLIGTGVPLLDLKAQFATIQSEVEEAIRGVCESQHFVMGPVVAEFESAVASYCSTKFAVGVSSGTDALLIALMALEVGPGDEVITSPFTFFATGGAIARLGATPVFCDIDPGTFNLSASAVQRFIDENCVLENDSLMNKQSGNRVKVLLPVDLFGQTADMNALLSIAKENHLRVVEDAAQAIGAEDTEGIRAGSRADIGCYSFFPSKNLGAFGDGGMCVTSDEHLAERLRVLRVHGGSPKYYHALIGGNFRLDALQAAVLLVKLKYLDSWTESRQQNAKKYDELLRNCAPSVLLPTVVDGCRHIFNQYTLRCVARDDLRAALQEKGIGSEVYYPVPLHLQECFKYLGYSAGDYPVTEAAAKSVISIPIYPELTDKQLGFVADCINDTQLAD